MNRKRFESLTAWLFTVSVIAAITWISISYLMGVYALKELGNTDLLVELSKEAMVTILGVNLMKMISNLFEHNNGGIFGTSVPTVRDMIDAGYFKENDREEDEADGFEPGDNAYR